MIKCRGRNGYFRFKLALIWKTETQMFLEIYSKKRGSSAPIEFRGEEKSMIEFFEEILKGLKSKTGMIKIPEVQDQ